MKAHYLFLIPALILVASCGISPVNYDPDDHADVVEDSRRNGSVVISLDTIFTSGIPYATIRTSRVVLPGRIGGAGSHLFLLSGARAVRIMPIRLYNADYLAYQFDDGRIADTAFLPYQQDILHDAKRVVEAGLLSRDGINLQHAREFTQQYKRPPYRAPQPGDQVIRERSQPVRTFGGEIWQTGVRIGRYDSTGISVSGRPCALITIYHIDSTECATITYCVAPPDSSAGIATRRDRRSHVVARQPQSTLLRSSLWFLTQNYYL